MSCQLDKTNICNISNCIVKVTGMKSNSASPTDTWFLSFNDDTYYKEQKVEKAFLKLFADLDSPSINNNIKLELGALKYELKVYKDVIRPLIDNNICPNFIKYLASAEKCSYDNLLRFLKGNLVYNNMKVDFSKLNVI